MISKRKGIVLAASLALALALTGCGNGGDNESVPTAAPTEKTVSVATPTEAVTTDNRAGADIEPTAAPTEAAQPQENENVGGPFSPKGSVIFEKDGLKVTTDGYLTAEEAGESEDCIKIIIENTDAADKYLGILDGAANNIVCDPIFIYGQDIEGDGVSYEFSLTVPAKSTMNIKLSHYGTGLYEVDNDPLSEFVFTFALASDEYGWYDYFSDPITIETGIPYEKIDITELGTVVLDNDTVTVVFGEQDYDDWFGPIFNVYALNKSDGYVSLSADSATVDGVDCDYVFFGTAMGPGQIAVSSVSFDGEARELKGFEDLDIVFAMGEGATRDELALSEYTYLDPVSVKYPHQNFGIYENNGLVFEIKPKYNDLVTVKNISNDPNGIIFSVAETKSLAAANYADGAGQLFEIARITADKLHEMLCHDMSGAEVFGKDDEGYYYVVYFPTDVRYERATAEELANDIDEWSFISDWAGNAYSSFADKNNLEDAYFGNTEVDIYVARAAYEIDTPVYLASLDYGEVSARWLSGEPYADFLLNSVYYPADSSETPDGEYVVISFPDEDVRLDFFKAPGSYVRVVSGGSERLYQSLYYDDNISFAEAVLGWNREACEVAGLIDIDEETEEFYGEWHEQIAGRGALSIHSSIAPKKVNISIRWAGSAFSCGFWNMIARVEDGKLIYENGEYEEKEYDEDGSEMTVDWNYDLTGWFEFNDEGGLVWHYDISGEPMETTFIRN